MTRTPINLIHDDIEEDPKRVDCNLLQKAPSETAEENPYLKISFAVYIVEQKRRDIEHRLNNDHCNGPVPHIQQTDHNASIEKYAYDAYGAGKNEMFIGRDDRPEDAHRKGKGKIKDQQQNHDTCLIKLLDGHRRTEHRIDIEIERRPQKQSYRTDNHIQDKKHTEHLVLFSLFAFGSEFCRISHDCITQPQVQDGQIRYDRGHE